MKSLSEIEEAIEMLPPEQFESLARWIAQKRDGAWDREFEADVKAGKLEAGWQNALEEIAAGEARPLEESRDDKDLPPATRSASQ